jgi:hypothetical protein
MDCQGAERIIIPAGHKQQQCKQTCQPSTRHAGEGGKRMKISY